MLLNSVNVNETKKFPAGYTWSVHDRSLKEVVEFKPGRTFKALEMYKGIEISVTDEQEETTEKDNVKDALSEDHGEKEKDVQKECASDDAIKPETLQPDHGFEIVQGAEGPEICSVKDEAN